MNWKTGLEKKKKKKNVNMTNLRYYTRGRKYTYKMGDN